MSCLSYSTCAVISTTRTHVPTAMHNIAYMNREEMVVAVAVLGFIGSSPVKSGEW